MTEPTETARELLWRHQLPEDVIDGALALFAQELAGKIRARFDGSIIDDVREQDADLISPENWARTDAPAVSAGVAPATDRECAASISGHCLAEGQSETACDTDAGECVHGGQPATDQAALRDRIAEAIRRAPSKDLRADWNAPNGPLQITARVNDLADAVLAVLPAPAEEHRLALSEALGLGTGAPWDAIHDRATELTLPPLGQDPVARRLGLVAEHRAAVYADVADRLAADAEQGAKEGFTRIYRRSAAKQVREWGEELRRVAAESAPADTGHACRNCEGIDPDTCLMNPDREQPEVDPQPVSDEFLQQLATVKVREDNEQATNRLRCPRCGEDITDYAEDDHVFRTGDDRPYCSGECVIAAHRAGLPTAPEQPAAAQQPKEA